MLKFDHFILNVDELYQNDKETINKLVSSGFPYEPSYGKGTRGFKVSNIWIGNEYFEMVRLLKDNGGGWKDDWVSYYNKGHRGLICIMLETNNLDSLYESLTKKEIVVSAPEYLQFKWFFNLFTRTMPWRTSYSSFLEGIPLQIGFQQMKSDTARSSMKKYMVPNSMENGIQGISKVVISGPLTDNDFTFISQLFSNFIIEKNPLTFNLSSNQTLIFQYSSEYSVDIYTDCHNKSLANNKIRLTNVSLYT